MEGNGYILGMIGLGTMGRNLMLNMAEHGFAVAGYDKDKEKVTQLEKEGNGMSVRGFNVLTTFLESLRSPKTIMLLVPAGKIVDDVISELLPLVDKGDIIIDSGNSHYVDTERRVTELEGRGVHFFGMGISGGEKGARSGPSMMPGGDKEAYKVVQPVLEAIAAKVNGEACVTYVGPGASGHFVKMVHNGIEYGLMQLIAESYQILKRKLHLDNEAIRWVFSEWNQGRLSSYLLEITAKIFSYEGKNTGHLLLDDIKDEAKAKGTGKWTSQTAMDLELPLNVIDTAVAMRDLSKYKSLRLQLGALYPSKGENLEIESKAEFLRRLEAALYFSSIITYAQGMHLLYKASATYGYRLRLADIARIWRGGCIIRADLLKVSYDALQRDADLEHLLLDKNVGQLIKETLPDIRFIVSTVSAKGSCPPAFAAALSYFDMITSTHLPSNLIQAQRDFFGAHTYELNGKEGAFHTEWEKE